MTASALSALAQTFAFLALGAWAVLAQSVLLRETLVVFFGNELSIGLTFSSWFLGIFLGALAGGRRAGTAPTASHAPDATLRFTVLFLALLGVLPLSLVLLRGSRFLVGIPAAELMPFGSMAILCLLTVTPTSLLIGLLFPAASALASKTARLSQAPLANAGALAIGRVYVVESLGGLLGGAAFTLLLLPKLDTLTAVSIFAVGVLLSLALLMLASGRKTAALALASCAFLAGCALALAVPSTLDTWTVRLRWASFGNSLPLRLSRDTPYQNIAIAGSGPYNLFSNGQIDASFPDEYGYASRIQPLMLEHPAPRSVLLLGGGITGAAREALRHPLTQLDIVESDPWLPEVLSAFLPEPDRQALADPRARLYRKDPRRFVLDSRDQYDLIILGFPDPTTASLNRLYTQEFFARLRTLLRPGGVLVTRISSSTTYLAGAALGLDASIYWTLREVFPVVLATPGEETFFVVSDDPSSPSLDPEVLKRRLVERGLELPFFQPEQIDMFLPRDRVDFLRDALAAAEDTPLNTDLKPVSYFYGLLLWDRYSGGKLAYPLSTFVRVPPQRYLLAALPLIALWVAFVLTRKGERRSRLQSATAIATTGFASIAFSLLLLLAFQNLFGNLYQEVALLVAVFMLGLALGAEAMRRALARARPLPAWSLLRLADAALLLYALLLVPALTLLVRSGPGPGAWMGFTLLLLAAGALTGAQFPAASQLYLGGRSDVTRAASRIDAADQVGAMAGALLTGVVLVPLAGFAGATLLIALLKAASLAALGRGGGR